MKQHFLVQTIKDLRTCRAVVRAIKCNVWLNNNELWRNIRRELADEMGMRYADVPSVEWKGSGLNQLTGMPDEDSGFLLEGYIIC